MIQQRAQSETSLSRPATALAAVTLVMVAVIAAGCAAIGAFAQIPIAGLTAALCLTASLIALLPIAWRTAVSPASGIAEGFMIGIGLRLFITGAAVLGLAQWMGDAKMSVGLWAAFWYLLLLAVEVRFIADMAGKAGRN